MKYFKTKKKMKTLQPSLPRILVYQDSNCDVLIEYLAFYGFDVIPTSDENVKSKLRENNYDLCILGHYKSNIPGSLELLQQLRAIDKKRPVIFVSDLFDPSYIVEAFTAGADDYLTRPYNLEELICRVKALLRRCGIKSRSVEPSYRIGNYIFDAKLNSLKFGATTISLTTKESKILGLLCAYRNEMLTRKLILHTVWDDDNYFNKRSLDVHICHLRKYLERDPAVTIETIRGLGYTLQAEG